MSVMTTRLPVQETYAFRIGFERANPFSTGLERVVEVGFMAATGPHATEPPA
jgi:hypothetical protein